MPTPGGEVVRSPKESSMVSVVIPVYNRASVVGRCLDSVLQQQECDFELIVVDDASSNPAEAVYQRVRDRGHTVLVMEENSGPGYCRNRGAEVARGEWLSFLDSDDHWLPGKLSRHLEALSQSGLEIGQTSEIWYRDGQRVSPPKAHRISGGDLFKRSLKAVCVSSSTVMLRKELFQQFGGFDEEMFVCEDYDLWLRIAAEKRFQHLDEELVVKYGGHEDQLSKALPAMDRYRILSILKWLSCSVEGEQRRAARTELLRKLRILGKGSAKRDRHRAVELCRELTFCAEQGHWSEGLKLAHELNRCWPTRPDSPELA